MTILEIVTIGSPGDKVLHRQADRVRDFGPALHQLLDNMVETMHDAPGVGLAAPQIGISKRMTVVEFPEDDERPEETLRIYELINPEIIRTKGAEVAEEGCLSLPGLTADVERATYVLVRAQDRHGKEFRIKVYDWLARIFQHEIDHLYGVMMTDRAEQVYRLRKTEDGEYEAVPVGESAS
jgi:peptide deformylase